MEWIVFTLNFLGCEMDYRFLVVRGFLVYSNFCFSIRFYKFFLAFSYRKNILNPIVGKWFCTSVCHLLNGLFDIILKWVLYGFFYFHSFHLCNLWRTQDVFVWCSMYNIYLTLQPLKNSICLFLKASYSYNWWKNMMINKI